MNRQQRRIAMKQAAKLTTARVPRISEIDVAAHHFQSGRTLQAEAACRAILAGGTKDAQGLHRLGLVASHFKRYDIAAELVRCAINLRPNHIEAYGDLSSILKAIGRYDEALEVCQAAIAVRPNSAELHNAIGRILRDRQQLADAAASYRKAISLEPRHAAAHFNLGLLFLELHELEAAEAQFREAVEVKPDFVDANRRLAETLRLQERLDEASEFLQQALKLDPDQRLYYAELGLVFAKQGRLLDAIEVYKKALAIVSDDTAILNNLGNTLDDLERFDEAIAAYEFSLRINRDNLTAVSNLGMVYRKKGRVREAIEQFRKVLATDSSNQTAMGELYQLRLAACDWEGIEEDEAAVLGLCRREATKEIPPFIVLSAPNATAADELSGARAWAMKYEVPADRRLLHRVPSAPATSGTKIRVGYLSSDFYNHATALLVAELFEKHDRSQFNVVGYSYGKDDHSPMRQRLVHALDDFIDVRAVSHLDVARRIYDDKIDILVDLKGHTHGARTPILAYRPAPIQANFLGYPGTMGADFIDYIIGDPTVLPMEHQPYYVERIVQLPHSYQPNDTKRYISAEAPTRAECGLPEGTFVFCCFNNNYKLGADLFGIWMRLLRLVPNSVLWLLESNDLVQENLKREAVTRGVDPSRLVFATRVPVSQHLARHCHADLFLDTLPYNAHTTASEALWTGLPVVTCLGDRFAGRVAASLLRAIGLPELVTGSLQEYEELALKLASNTGMLKEITGKLARNRLTTPLFDIETYTRDLERAYVQMVEIWQSGRSPEAFVVG